MSDVEAANSAIRNRRLAPLIQKISQLIKPDSTFFYSDNGVRAAMFVFDMRDVSLIPQIAEPFFSELNAKVEFLPVMYPNELSQGLEAWQKSSGQINELS
jgi:hypothetical protein